MRAFNSGMTYHWSSLVQSSLVYGLARRTLASCEEPSLLGERERESYVGMEYLVGSGLFNFAFLSACLGTCVVIGASHGCRARTAPAWGNVPALPSGGGYSSEMTKPCWQPFLA